MLSDRKRVELFLPVHIALEVLIAGVADPRQRDRIECKNFLLAAAMEPTADLPKAMATKITNRAFRLHDQIVRVYAPIGRERADVAGLVLYFWMRNLIDIGYLILPEETNFAKALDILLPALQHTTDDDKLMADARRKARIMHGALQDEGYFGGASLPPLEG